MSSINLLQSSRNGEHLHWHSRPGHLRPRLQLNHRLGQLIEENGTRRLGTANNNLHCRAGVTPVEPLKATSPRCSTHFRRRKVSRLLTIANTAAWPSGRPENPEA